MNLFEITYKKLTLNENGDATFTTTKKYQIVALNEIQAAFTLGQIFNDDCSYEITITDIKKVR